MALIKCKNCGHTISDKAKHCPKCGAENSMAKTKPSKHIPPLPKQRDDQTGSSDNDYKLYEELHNKNRQKYLLLAILAILLICGAGYYIHSRHTNNNPEHSNSEQLLADSIAKAQAEAQAQAELEKARLDSIRQDSIARRNFTSPDLAFAELHGKVKSCVWKSKVSEMHYDGTLTFNEDGTLSPHKGHKFVRDKKGNITKIKYKEKYYDEDFFEISYVWMDGKIISASYEAWEGGGDNKYTYDENGLLKKETSESGGEGYEWLTTVTYSNYEFDEMGNWIKRTVTNSSKEYYCDELTDSQTKYYTETRTITYYDNDSATPKPQP